MKVPSLRYRRLSVLLLLASPLAAQQPGAHPLDALSSAEIRTVAGVIRASGRTDSLTVFASVQLREPPKSEVLAWTAGRPFRREALAVLRQRGRTVEAVVDIAGRTLASWREVPGAQSHATDGEWDAAGEVIKQNAEVRAALARRGVTDLSTVRCGAGPRGYFDTPEQRGGRRLFRGGCGDVSQTYNTMARNFAGLVVWVDMDARRVIRVMDSGALPMATGGDDFDDESTPAARPALAPIQVLQPLGPGFRREGGVVTWDRWRFHVRVDPRIGVVIATATWDDHGRARSVLYEGSLSEIFVPYMDSTNGWWDRVFIDAGEYAFGGIAETLEPGVDCPAGAAWIDAPVAGAAGLPRVKRRVACLFERETGVTAWRHGYEDTERVSGRGARELVIRWNATVGNYDYLFDWVFKQTGAIGVAVGATGVLEVRQVASAAATDAGAAEDTRFGRLLAPHVLGVNHDHYFSFRLDLDVDGSDNALAVDSLRRMTLPASHPRRSLWTLAERIARTERDAQLDMNMERPTVWRVVNQGVRGPLGYPVSYEIKAGHNAMSLMSAEDWPVRRAGFSTHHLWVTPYAPDERYAAGDYPTLSSREMGLAEWTRADRPVANTDIVVWYTLGFHHVTRAEDWPVMPTAWHDFELRPFDFFPANPALDLPRR
jgi:primary-amine oxidase